MLVIGTIGGLGLFLFGMKILSEGMQKILNTWVSCRTTQYLCIKISTQLRYLTYRTLNGQLIESPHDFSEVDISTLYTSKTEHYQKRLYDIVSKRLSLANIVHTPDEYFPSDSAQDKKIEAIKRELKEAWEKGEGKGYRASDDVTRYAIPEYMKTLAGNKKNSATYSYAGFKNIVDISSGVIRFFLEPAAQMYAATKAQQTNDDYVSSIPSNIQDNVLKDWSEDFILSEFEKLKKDVNGNSDVSAQYNNDKSVVSELFSLINGLGILFRKVLLSDGSQRRIFSIMVNGKMDDRLQRVFELGIEWGYFQMSTAASKEGAGRRYRFVLSRRLAPYFKLDTSSYAGHLSVTVSDLNLACKDHEKFVKNRIEKMQNNKEISQKDIFSMDFSV